LDTTKYVCLVKVDDIYRRVGEPGPISEQVQLADAVRQHLPPDISWEVGIVQEAQVGEVEGVSTDVLYEDAVVLHIASEIAGDDPWWRAEGSHCMICIMDDHTIYELLLEQLVNLQKLLRGAYHREGIRFRVVELLGRVERKIARLKGQGIDKDTFVSSVRDNPPVPLGSPESDFLGYPDDPSSVAARYRSY